MMMRFIAIPVCTLSLVLASQTLAQEAPAATTALKQAMAFDAYAGCIVARDRSTADLLVLESRYSGQIGPLVKKLFPTMKGCLKSKDQALLRISPFLLRGALARALLDDNVPASRAYVVPSDADVAGPSGERASMERFVLQFSQCLIKAEPEASRDFVRALGGSPEERDAFARLAPATESCVRETPSEVKLTAEPLRTGLAIALYGQTAGDRVN